MLQMSMARCDRFIMLQELNFNRKIKIVMKFYPNKENITHELTKHNDSASMFRATKMMLRFEPSCLLRIEFDGNLLLYLRIEIDSSSLF